MTYLLHLGRRSPWAGQHRAGEIVVRAPHAWTADGSSFAEGDRVASEHIGRGTHTGPLQTTTAEIPATGRKVELRIAEFYEMRGGKIIRLHAYYDTANMMRQFCLLPSRGSWG